MIRGILCVRRCTFEEMGKLLPLIQITYEGMKVTKLLVDSDTNLATLGVLRAMMGLGVRARAEK